MLWPLDITFSAATKFHFASQLHLPSILFCWALMGVICGLPSNTCKGCDATVLGLQLLVNTAAVCADSYREQF